MPSLICSYCQDNLDTSSDFKRLILLTTEALVRQAELARSCGDEKTPSAQDNIAFTFDDIEDAVMDTPKNFGVSPFCFQFLNDIDDLTGVQPLDFDADYDGNSSTMDHEDGNSIGYISDYGSHESINWTPTSRFLSFLTNDSSFPCKFCDKLIKKRGMKAHLQRVHIECDKDFQCQHCPKKFPENRRLKKHVKKFHIPIHYCNDCSFSSKDLDVVQTHENHAHRIPLPKKPKIGPKIAKRKAKKIKIQIHHCGECSFASRNLKVVNLHAFHAHNTSLPENESRKLKRSSVKMNH